VHEFAGELLHYDFSHNIYNTNIKDHINKFKETRYSCIFIMYYGIILDYTLLKPSSKEL